MDRKPVYFGTKKRIISCPNGLWQAQMHDPWVALGLIGKLNPVSPALAGLFCPSCHRFEKHDLRTVVGTPSTPHPPL